MSQSELQTDKLEIATFSIFSLDLWLLRSSVALAMFLLTMGNFQYYPVSTTLENDSADDIPILLLNVRLKTCFC